jgi:hypothetical protein
MFPETPQHTALAWRFVETKDRIAWEAAAQAVLADALRQVMPPTGTLTPLQWVEEMRRLVGQYWAGVDVDAYVASVRGEPPAQEDAP